MVKGKYNQAVVSPVRGSVSLLLNFGTTKSAQLINKHSINTNRGFVNESKQTQSFKMLIPPQCNFPPTEKAEVEEAVSSFSSSW